MDVVARKQSVGHGENRLPDVEVRSYSMPLKAGDAFLGDLASGSEFRKVLREERHRIRNHEDPPFGDDRTHDLDGDDLDEALKERRSSHEGRVVEEAIEAFSDRFASVLNAFLETREWSETQRIVCGGGLMEGGIGAELIRRTQARLENDRPTVELRRLHHAPDDAGMIGWTHVAPAEALNSGNAFVAVDIGGTNLRWGVVQFDDSGRKAAAQHVIRRDKWCHASEAEDRDAFVERMALGIHEMIEAAGSDGVRLCPLVGLSCPGVVLADGRISSGAHNLPGEWSDGAFSLPLAIADRVGRIAGRMPFVMLHNDAVVQALSELPHVQDVERWAAVTLGTGLGNCSFRNLRPMKDG